MRRRSAVRRALGAGLALALTATTVPLAAASERPSASADEVATIVTAGSADAAGAAVRRVGGQVTVELPYLGAVAADVPASAVDALAAAPGVYVAPDEPVELTSVDTAAGPGLVADQAQLAALSLPEHWTPRSGEGVGVALLDTGVADVPELAGRVIHGPDLSGDGDHLDGHGHGTFMAGLIAADGSARDGDRPLSGVAPGAHIVSVKLAGRDGRTTVSRVLEGIGWTIANQDRHNVRVLNLSLGVATNRAPQADPLVAAVEAAWASGITVVAPSGNGGRNRVTSPGRSPWILTVGATDTRGTGTATDDTLATWSGYGKVTSGHKPDVVAPGVSVTSLRAPGSAADVDHPEGRVGAHHFRGSGTSMATALTTGAVAVLADLRPFATPDDLKGALTSTTRRVAGSQAGTIDVSAADAAIASPAWRQRHHGKVMPWSGPGAPPQAVAWERARWLDGEWSRARWLDGEWQRARWLIDDWSRARWLQDDWTRARWLDGSWTRARWLDEGWTRARWLDESFARARWLDASFARARWLDLDWTRARWLAFDGALGDPVNAAAGWGTERPAQP